jgi:hypothetical protein
MAVLALAIATGPAAAQKLLLDAHLDTSVDFPNTLTFHLNAHVPFVIEKTEIHYNVEQLTCGTGISIGAVEVTPGETVSVSWKWDLRDSGGLPIGARVSYSWVVSGQGQSLETVRETITFDDPRHDWRMISGEHTQILWYEGSDAFAEDLLNAAERGARQLAEATGVTPTKPVTIRIYNSSAAMQETVLFAQEWSGGAAFPRHGVVVMGINIDNLDWGRDAMVHEMTHVVLGQYTFTCGTSLPAWLDEGLAVYNEGPVAPVLSRALATAISTDSAFTIQGIAGSFPTAEEGALLAYAQSRSIVAFLLDTYGPEKMNDLLKAFPHLATIERALQRVYGFDLEGLQAAWRDSVGLPPQISTIKIAPEPIPEIPTLGLPQQQTTSGAQITPIPTMTATATSFPTQTPTPMSSGGAGCNRSSADSSGLDGGLVVSLMLGSIIIGRKFV